MRLLGACFTGTKSAAHCPRRTPFGDSPGRTHGKCALAAVALVFAACACLLLCVFYRDPDPRAILAGHEIEVLWYEHGRPTLTCTLSPESIGARELVRLLQNHRRRWWPSLVSYAPGMLFRGEDFEVDIHDNLVILNYECYKDRYVQVTGSADPYEMRGMLNALMGKWQSFEE
jgi:hypothetical protein